jgi:hypothetical protein
MGRAAQLQLDATVLRHPQPFLREGSPQPVAAEVEQAQPVVLVDLGPGLEGIPLELHRKQAGGALLLQWPWQAGQERLGLQVRRRILRVGLVEQPGLRCAQAQGAARRCRSPKANLPRVRGLAR